MKTNPTVTFALTAGVLGGALALAAAPVSPALPATWTHDRLASATYVILEPQMTGPNLFNASQRQALLDAMKRDSAGALKRRYPQAVIGTDASAANVIKVTPSVINPSALVPWATLTGRLDFALPDGTTVAVKDQFGLLTLWQKQTDVANFVYDQLALKLP